MAQTEYTIDIDLQASKEKTWEIITDFKQYESWNTILSMSNNDQLEIGKKFHVTIYGRKKPSKFKATTLTKDQYKSFAAQQKILGKWFFSATHHFIIEELTIPNQVKFIQQWQLTGIVGKLFKKQIFKELAQFKKMNEELKGYVEI